MNTQVDSESSVRSEERQTRGDALSRAAAALVRAERAAAAARALCVSLDVSTKHMAKRARMRPLAVEEFNRLEELETRIAVSRTELDAAEADPNAPAAAVRACRIQVNLLEDLLEWEIAGRPREGPQLRPPPPELLT